MTRRSVSAVGMLCSESPCAPLHTSHRCDGIHSRGRRNAHHSRRNILCCCVLFVFPAPLYSCLSGHHPWWSLGWVPGLLLPEPTHIRRIGGQSLARLATSVLIGQEVDCIQRTVQLGPVSSGVIGHLLAEHGVIRLSSCSATLPGLT